MSDDSLKKLTEVDKLLKKLDYIYFKIGGKKEGEPGKEVY